MQKTLNLIYCRGMIWDFSPLVFLTLRCNCQYIPDPIDIIIGNKSVIFNVWCYCSVTAWIFVIFPFFMYLRRLNIIFRWHHLTPSLLVYISNTFAMVKCSRSLQDTTYEITKHTNNCSNRINLSDFWPRNDLDLLRHLDFEFVFLMQAVSEALSIGAPLLLPPLRERMELLHSLLPQGPDRWDSLTRGQVWALLLINIIFV